MKTLSINLILGILGTVMITLSSCTKYAEQVADIYVGTLEMNDSLVSSSAQIEIEEVENNVVAVSSGFFDTYEVEIDKQRYFASKSYFSTDPDEQLEVFDDGNITFVHNDENGNQFSFVGERD